MVPENIAYEEDQKFSQRWVTIVLYLAMLLAIVVPIIAFTRGSIKFVFFLPALFMLGLILLFQNMRLTLRVDESGVYYRFLPFHLHSKSLSRENIQSISVIIYDPISEYGGWGIRRGTAGMAYTTGGKHGLKILLNNGRRLLIGTKNPEHLSKFLKEHAYFRNLEE